LTVEIENQAGGVPGTVGEGGCGDVCALARGCGDVCALARGCGDVCALARDQRPKPAHRAHAAASRGAEAPRVHACGTLVLSVTRLLHQVSNLEASRLHSCRRRRCPAADAAVDLRDDAESCLATCGPTLVGPVRRKLASGLSAEAAVHHSRRQLAPQDAQRPASASACRSRSGSAARWQARQPR
jgi:hypothetical protein